MWVTAPNAFYDRFAGARCTAADFRQRARRWYQGQSWREAAERWRAERQCQG